MVDLIANNMDNIYRGICSKVLEKGESIPVLEKGFEKTCTKELNNFSFELTNLDNNIINIRNISKSYLCAELTWYMLGRNDLEFIQPFANLWGRLSDDGKTCYSAYGDIVFKRHGFDQIDKIIELLAKDPSSRRAVVNFNVPNQNVIETKDEVCTIALQFYIRDNKLYCTGIMRSNDIWTGLPYDTVFFTELQKYIAHRLNVEYGTYTHFAISLHVYDRNFEDIKKVVDVIQTEKLSFDIEALDRYKRLIEKAVTEETDKVEKRRIIIETCEALNILTVKEI